MKKLKILVYMHLNLASTLYPSSSQISEHSFLSTEFEDILRIPSLRSLVSPRQKCARYSRKIVGSRVYASLRAL